MTFDTQEQSASDGAPLALIRFQRLTQSWFFSDQDAGSDLVTTVPGFYDKPLFYGTDPLFYRRTWQNSGIDVSDITDSGKIEKIDVELGFPLSDTFAADFMEVESYDRTFVTIYRKHWGGDETVVQFKGRVIRADPRGERIYLICRSLQGDLRRSGLSRRGGKYCEYGHYEDRRCSLDIADHYVSEAAVTGADNAFTIAAAALVSDGVYRGGVLEYNGAKETIVSHVGSAIVTRRPHFTLSSEIASSGSAAARIAPGCKRTQAACIAFSNDINYGGCSNLQKGNPFAGEKVV